MRFSLGLRLLVLVLQLRGSLSQDLLLRQDDLRDDSGHLFLDLFQNRLVKDLLILSTGDLHHFVEPLLEFVDDGVVHVDAVPELLQDHLIFFSGQPPGFFFSPFLLLQGPFVLEVAFRGDGNVVHPREELGVQVLVADCALFHNCYKYWKQEKAISNCVCSSIQISHLQHLGVEVLLFLQTGSMGLRHASTGMPPIYFTHILMSAGLGKCWSGQV